MKKIFKLITISAASLVFIVPVAFAGIPGITEPYDPPNYYSPTSVSVPDSEPSPFALTDLARQGYQVHDVTNSKKDIISTIKTYIDLLQNTLVLTTQTDDLRHSNDNFNEKISPLINDLNYRSHYAEDINLDDINNMLYNASTIIAANPYEQKNISLSDKYSYLNKIYSTTLDYARDDLNSYTDRKLALMDTIQAFNNIETTMQAQEKTAEMEILKFIEEKYRQQLIYQLTVLEIARLKDEEDAYLRGKVVNQNVLTRQFEDPYNPSDYYKAHYEKEKAIGFIDFK